MTSVKEEMRLFRCNPNPHTENYHQSITINGHFPHNTLSVFMVGNLRI